VGVWDSSKTVEVIVMADKPGPVLVTGANSGIGLATTLLLARRGWQTWGTVRSKAKAKALSDAAAAAKVDALVQPVVLDVSDATVKGTPRTPPAWHHRRSHAGRRRRLSRCMPE
jgi:NAD(P)-dependent dehydrogenase (short-subunit alcohol dehydrogenase family)